MKKSELAETPRALRKALLSWYDEHQRTLPWRARGDEISDPYFIWLSEIMLQQTTVTTVKPYFEAFTRRWPKVQDLAQADLDEVLHGWQGLGYYARARNLHQCAQVISRQHGGRFPETPEELQKLPGVGPYTSKAIGAIAFQGPYVPIDGNVKRVLSRLYATADDVSPLAKALESPERPGDFAQALMDLGATVCTPKNPNCDTCPWKKFCCARKAGAQGLYPPKKNKPLKPTRYATAFILEREDGAIALQRRSEKGLLGGMMEIPTSPWTEDKTFEEKPPLETHWERRSGVVRHTFTHFHFEVKVQVAKINNELRSYTWVLPENLDQYALPTLMKKIIAHGFGRGF